MKIGIKHSKMETSIAEEVTGAQREHTNEHTRAGPKSGKARENKTGSGRGMPCSMPCGTLLQARLEACRFSALVVPTAAAAPRCIRGAQLSAMAQLRRAGG